MRAAVVYESLWGNTEQIAQAIAEGIGPNARAVTTSDAAAALGAGLDLLVIGAPLLGFGLATEEMRASIGTAPAGAPLPPDLTHPSMRSWLDSLQLGSCQCATFETRIWWSPGSAAKKMMDLLEAKGLHRIAEPARFVVTGKYGPLKSGEIERAQAWGAQLAGSVDA